jgi:hypothetical protein
MLCRPEATDQALRGWCTANEIQLDETDQLNGLTWLAADGGRCDDEPPRLKPCVGRTAQIANREDIRRSHC